jgi:predicted O-methyltransferase YrrM
MQNKTNLIGCEVGVYFGAHAKQMVDGLDLKELHLVDKYWREDIMFSKARDLLRSTEEEEKDFIWHIGWSVRVAESIKNEYFDFIYIDANHGYDDAYTDLKAWYPKLKKGGFMAGHDWNIESVQQAVEDYMRENNLKGLKCENDPNGANEDWYFKK